MPLFIQYVLIALLIFVVFAFVFHKTLVRYRSKEFIKELDEFLTKKYKKGKENEKSDFNKQNKK